MKPLILSFISGVLSVILLFFLIIYFIPERLGIIWGFDAKEFHNRMLGRTVYLTDRMDRDWESTLNNPKFALHVGRTDSGSVKILNIAEKGKCYQIDPWGDADTLAVPNSIAFRYDEIDFSGISRHWKENSPVYVVLDNKETIMLKFSTYKTNEGISVSSSIDGDYAREIQRKILNSELVRVKFINKQNQQDYIDYDVKGLNWEGLERL